MCHGVGGSVLGEVQRMEMSHSEHRFPTPSSRDVVNQCLEFGEVCVWRFQISVKK